MADQENDANPGLASVFSSQEIPQSSPLAPSSVLSNTSRASSKVKKPPPITPRRFTRFFHPRTSGSRSSTQSGRQLRELTQNATNKQINTASASGPQFDDESNTRLRKRRKFLLNAEEAPSTQETLSLSSPPLQSSPCQRSPAHVHNPLTPECDEWNVHCRLPVVRSRALNGSQHGPHWRSVTSKFFTGPGDVHDFEHIIPFSTAPCNS